MTFRIAETVDIEAGAMSGRYVVEDVKQYTNDEYETTEYTMIPLVDPDDSPYLLYSIWSYEL
jgi:hypothetical protein